MIREQVQVRETQKREAGRACSLPPFLLGSDPAVMKAMG